MCIRDRLSGFLQDILKQIKALLLENSVLLPGILLLVAVHDYGQFLHRSLFKLRGDGFCNLLGGVGVYIIDVYKRQLKSFPKGHVIINP